MELERNFILPHRGEGITGVWVKYRDVFGYCCRVALMFHFGFMLFLPCICYTLAACAFGYLLDRIYYHELCGMFILEGLRRLV